MLKHLRVAVAGTEGERDYALRATVSARLATAARLRALGDSLREALVVSHLTLVEDDDLEDDEPHLTLSAAEGEKCARCRKTLPLSGDPVHPTICAPCAAIVREFDA